MKVRNGFVSNSSSASFIVVWRDKLDEITDAKNALTLLFDLFLIGDMKMEDRDWNDSTFLDTENGKFINRNLFKAAKKVLENTIVRNGKFETRFYTSMLNDVDDFGDEAKSFVMALMLRDRRWEIVYTMVDGADWEY